MLQTETCVPLTSLVYVVPGAVLHRVPKTKATGCMKPPHGCQVKIRSPGTRRRWHKDTGRTRPTCWPAPQLISSDQGLRSPAERSRAGQMPSVRNLPGASPKPRFLHRARKLALDIGDTLKRQSISAVHSRWSCREKGTELGARGRGLAVAVRWVRWLAGRAGCGRGMTLVRARFAVAPANTSLPRGACVAALRCGAPQCRRQAAAWSKLASRNPFPDPSVERWVDGPWTRPNHKQTGGSLSPWVGGLDEAWLLGGASGCEMRLKQRADMGLKLQPVRMTTSKRQHWLGRKDPSCVNLPLAS